MFGLAIAPNFGMPQTLRVRSNSALKSFASSTQTFAVAPAPVERSQFRALDALNVFVADMRDGVGPYLTLFLVQQKDWSPSRIGWAIAVGSFATLASTIVAGAVLDRSRFKNLWVAGASIAIAVLTGLFFFVSGFWSILCLQAATGVASAFIGPGIVALSRMASENKHLPLRIGRNETFNHGGNFAAAMVSAFLVRNFHLSAIFALVIFMSIAAASAAFFVRNNPADHPAQVLPMRRAIQGRQNFADFLKSGEFLFLLLLSVIFQFVNASLVSVETQSLAKISEVSATTFLSYGIIIAQLIAIPTAWGTGILSKKISPQFCLAFGIAMVLIRCLIFATCHDLQILVGAQILDGFAAGVIAVAPILALLGLTQGERSGTTAGFLATSIGLGAAVSNLASGYIVEGFGPNTLFLFMAGTAAVLLTTLLIGQSAQELRRNLAPTLATAGKWMREI